MFEVKMRSNVLKILKASDDKIFHLLKDFLVNLPLITEIGILLSFKFNIKLGHISESTKNTACGFQTKINFLIKKLISKGKYLCVILSLDLNSSFIDFQDDKVIVVIKKLYLFVFLSILLIIGIML